MNYPNIGTSKGEMYDVVHQEIINTPALMVTKAVAVQLVPQSEDKSPVAFRINYFIPYFLRRPMDAEQIVEHARGEIVMFLEGDTEEWENPQPNGYILNKR